MIEAILTDIEGTTSSIAFVKNVLFPYAAKAIPDYVRTHRDDVEVRKILADTANESGIAGEDIEGLIQQLLDWIAVDKKITPLKALQGLVWRAGYEHGEYRAHMYPDAAAQLRAWHRRGIKLYVYSSGSIAAQQLFFRYSEAGDLTPLFSGYFDTSSGAKQEERSYRNIAQTIQLPPERILFLSDVIAELDAARAAGMRTTLLRRPQDTTVTGKTTHDSAESFLNIIG